MSARSDRYGQFYISIFSTNPITIVPLFGMRSGTQHASRPRTRDVSSRSSLGTSRPLTTVGRRVASRSHSTTTLLRPYGSAAVQAFEVSMDSSPVAVAAADHAARGEPWLQHSATSVELDCVECEECFQMVPTRRMAHHRAHQCPERPVPCPNRCGRMLPAREVPQHMRVDCPVSERQQALARSGEEHRKPQPCRLGCRALVPPTERLVHETTHCPRRTVSCESCGASMAAQDKPRHIANECKAVALREELVNR